MIFQNLEAKTAARHGGNTPFLNVRLFGIFARLSAFIEFSIDTESIDGVFLDVCDARHSFAKKLGNHLLRLFGAQTRFGRESYGLRPVPPLPPCQGAATVLPDPAPCST